MLRQFQIRNKSQIHTESYHVHVIRLQVWQGVEEQTNHVQVKVKDGAT